MPETSFNYSPGSDRRPFFGTSAWPTANRGTEIMDPEIKKLQELRASLANKIRTLADTQDKWTAEDEATWGNLNADYDTCLKDLEARVAEAKAEETLRQTIQDRRNLVDGYQDYAPRALDRDGIRNQGQQIQDGPTEQHRLRAFASWWRNQAGIPLTDQEVESCRVVGMNPNAHYIDANIGSTGTLRATQWAFTDMGTRQAKRHAEAEFASRFRNDLTTGTGSSGGYTIPEGFVNALEINMLAFGGMLQVADIMRTDSGQQLPWPTATDTGNTGELLAESGAIGSSVDPTFAEVLFNAYKFSSKLVKVPTELLEDSAFDMPGVLGAMLGERLGRVSNTYLTTGTGTAQPKGIVIAATLGKTATSATALTFDEVIDLEHSVDPAYRSNAGYMCHDNIILYVRKLKDSNNQYLWMSGANTGTPDTLNARPFTINQDMDSAMTTAKKVLLFGQLTKYKVRQVRRIRFRRLVELYAGNDQEGFVAFMRMDGDLLDAGTAPVKYLQLA